MMRLKIEREKMGWSQSELARRIGANPVSISRIERGKEPPYPLRSQRIADALGWEGDPAELFEDVTDPRDAGKTVWRKAYFPTVVHTLKCGHSAITAEGAHPKYCPECGKKVD